MSDQLAVIPQYLMPKLAMTRLAGRVASAEWGTVTTWVIKRFVKRYNVNMSEAAHADPAHYKSFNAAHGFAPSTAPSANAEPLNATKSFKLKAINTAHGLWWAAMPLWLRNFKMVNLQRCI
ncbi:MAG: Phosphatidylserine decarboxylase proenzyme [Pseudomonadota bacterium]